MSPPAAETLQLRDIHLPAPPDFWPPAPGWWLLAAICLGLLIWSSHFVWQRLKIRRQRKKILDLLTQLELSSEDRQPTEFLARLSRLLRQLALMRFPRHEVAPLTGKDWLQFLDDSGGNGRFCKGPGQLLAEGPYLRELPGTIDTQALTMLVRDWIKKNTGA